MAVPKLNPNGRKWSTTLTTSGLLVLVNVVGLVVIVLLQINLLQPSGNDLLDQCASVASRRTATTSSSSQLRSQQQQREEEEDQSFSKILMLSESDKYSRHHYERYYRDWLAPYRHQQGVKLLEIGAERGRSLKVWQNYFADPGPIVGLAYGSMTENVETVVDTLDKIEVVRGDQSKDETMDLLIKKGPWDIIIDDGSHLPAHMVFSFFRLWKAVKPGGLYVIEDLETNYWAEETELYGYLMKGTGITHGPQTNAVAKFKQFIDVLNRYQIGAKELSIMDGDADICSIEWGMNVVAFKKCSNDDQANATPSMEEPTKYKGTEMLKWLQEAKSSNPT